MYLNPPKYTWKISQILTKMRFRYFFRSSKKRTSSKTLEAALGTMRDLITNLTFEQHPGTNLSVAERKALRQIMDDNALIINKADKGSTIVVQNHKDYAFAGFKHLNDDKVYKKLDFDLTKDVCIKLHTFQNKLFKGLINKDMLEFCSPPEEVRAA